MIKKKYSLFFLLVPVINVAFGQQNIPIDTWRTHTSYFSGENITLSEYRIFATSDNGLFFVDLEDNTISTLSTTDQLSSVETGAILWLPESEQLLVSYSDGNIDFWSENEIINFTAIKNASIIGSKEINHITFNAGLVYLSAEFGVVVIEPNEIVVEESYLQLGPQGEQLEVNASAFTNDSIYLATNGGILSASLGPETNRQDFSFWKRSSIKGLEITAITSLGGTLFAAIESDSIYRFIGNQWINTNLPAGEGITQFQDILNEIVLINESGIFLISADLIINSILIDGLNNPVNLETNDGINFWITDSEIGLVRSDLQSFQQVVPNGPLFNAVEDIAAANGEVAIVFGGFDQNLNPLRIAGGFSVFENGQWRNFRSETDFAFSQDLNSVHFSNSRPAAYFASFGYGLLEWDLQENFELFDENSPGSTLDNLTSQPGFTLVTDSKTDAQGNIWLTTIDSASTKIHLFDGADNWAELSFDLPGNPQPTDLLVTSSGILWVTLHEEGILVFNPSNQIFRVLNSTPGNGNLPDEGSGRVVVNQIVEDLSGQIWVATSRGVVAFPFPSAVLTDQSIDASVPIIDGRFLFNGESVNTIAVDPGNRKWIGTNNGLFLFNESVSELENSFTTDNSPLFTNRIERLGINDLTGEVFVATDRGLMSYRSNTSLGEGTHVNVNIFPNPVTPDFNGTIGISGLVNNAIIKITDISGKLVRELNANGGTASWNGLTVEGKRATTGIYLVFSSSADGSETFVGKIAFVE